MAVGLSLGLSVGNQATGNVPQTTPKADPPTAEPDNTGPCPAYLVGERSPAPTPSQDADTLKVLSWNTYLLPRWTRRTDQATRLEGIIQALTHNRYDVVCLQEVFPAWARQRLVDALEDLYPYISQPLGRRGLIRQTSGLLIFSRHPFNRQASTLFDQCKGVDCWAHKGAIMVEVLHHGRPVQLVTTHAQAFNGNGRQEVRFRQYEQMVADLLDPHGLPQVPQLVLGDFNTNAYDTAHYRTMLRTFAAQDVRTSTHRAAYPTYTGLTNSWVAPGDDDYVSCLDHILLRPQGSPMRVAKVAVRRFSYRDKGCTLRPLSDHEALEAQFVFAGRGA